MNRLQMNKFWLYVIVIIIAAVVLFPIYILLLISLVPVQYTSLGTTYPTLVPPKFTLSNFVQAFKIGLTSPLIKSLEVAFLVGGIALLIGIPAAYGLSKLKPVLANSIATLLFLSNMMPAISIAIPIAVQFVRAGLYDSVLGLALAQELIVLPLSIFILLGSFQALPRDLESQARLDGAGLFRTIFGLLVPLAKAGVVATFLLAWITSWNEFTFAAFLSPIHPTLQIEIYENITRGNIFASAAFSLIVTIPVIILAIVLAKYLKGEYLAGGLNG